MAEKISEKWEEVLDFARQHTTKQDIQTVFQWLQGCFN